MTTEQRMEDLSLDQTVAASVIRLRRLWPRQLDGPEIIAEYRRVLAKAPDVETVVTAVDRVIDETADGYLPRPGAFAKVIAECSARRRREDPRSRIDHKHWVDESALIDALAYIEQAPNDVERAYAERQVQAIRMRLKDRGAMVEARQTIRWKRAPQHPADPPNTIRFMVIRPESADADEDDYHWPKGPKNGAVMAAIAPLALVVISGAWRVLG